MQPISGAMSQVIKVASLLLVLAVLVNLSTAQNDGDSTLPPEDQLTEDNYTSAFPIVCTQNGCIEGVAQPGYQIAEYEAFFGIPYAEPPVGDLRFAVSTRAKDFYARLSHNFIAYLLLNQIIKWNWLCRRIMAALVPSTNIYLPFGSLRGCWCRLQHHMPHSVAITVNSSNFLPASLRTITVVTYHVFFALSSGAVCAYAATVVRITCTSYFH